MFLFHVFIVNDTLDDILGESGDEEESDAVVSQVLDEIGIEITGKVKPLRLITTIRVLYCKDLFFNIFVPFYTFSCVVVVKSRLAC